MRASAPAGVKAEPGRQAGIGMLLILRDGWRQCDRANTASLAARSLYAVVGPVLAAPLLNC